MYYIIYGARIVRNRNNWTEEATMREDESSQDVLGKLTFKDAMTLKEAGCPVSAIAALLEKDPRDVGEVLEIPYKIQDEVVRRKMGRCEDCDEKVIHLTEESEGWATAGHVHPFKIEESAEEHFVATNFTFLC